MDSLKSNRIQPITALILKRPAAKSIFGVVVDMEENAQCARADITRKKNIRKLPLIHKNVKLPFKWIEEIQNFDIFATKTFCL
jgi:hypothetical protein